MNNSLVSVVIPTYNHARFLGRALQSVMDQTYPHWEALVVDNHSNDNTDEVVGSFADPRIRLLKIRNRGVIAASRNLGMREAKGEWIAFLDSDDCWYPKKLEVTMANAHVDDAYDVLSCDELMVDERTGARKVLRYGPFQGDFYRILLVEGNRLSPSATVVRRHFLLRNALAFDESQDYVTVEDYGFWLDLARAEARFKFVHEVQGEYTMHQTNNSSRLQLHWKNCEALLFSHVFNVQQFDSSPEKLWKRVSTRLRLGQVKQLVANGQRIAAFQLGLKTLIASPASAITYLAGKLKKRLGISGS